MRKPATSLGIALSGLILLVSSAPALAQKHAALKAIDPSEAQYDTPPPAPPASLPPPSPPPSDANSNPFGSGIQGQPLGAQKRTLANPNPPGFDETAPGIPTQAGQGWNPPPAANSADESRVARLEQMTFGSAYPEHEVDDRIDHLEVEVFNKKNEGMPVDQRLSRLEAKLLGQTAFGQAPAPPPKAYAPPRPAVTQGWNGGSTPSYNPVTQSQFNPLPYQQYSPGPQGFQQQRPPQQSMPPAQQSYGQPMGSPGMGTPQMGRPPMGMQDGGQPYGQQMSLPPAGQQTGMNQSFGQQNLQSMGQQSGMNQSFGQQSMQQPVGQQAGVNQFSGQQSMQPMGQPTGSNQSFGQQNMQSMGQPSGLNQFSGQRPMQPMRQPTGSNQSFGQQNMQPVTQGYGQPNTFGTVPPGGRASMPQSQPSAGMMQQAPQQPVHGFGQQSMPPQMGQQGSQAMPPAAVQQQPPSYAQQKPVQTAGAPNYQAPPSGTTQPSPPPQFAQDAAVATALPSNVLPPNLGLTPKDRANADINNIIKSIPSKPSAGDYAVNIAKFTNDSVARWTSFPVLVHLPLGSPANWHKALDEAVSSWGSFIPVRVAAPSESADIEVAWINHLPPRALGQTNLEVFNGRMRVTVYLLRPSYYLTGISEKMLRRVAEHEMGHALGLFGHSSDQHDLMYPLETLHSKDSTKSGGITPRDLNTLRRIYESEPLPHGFQSPHPMGWSLEH